MKTHFETSISQHQLPPNNPFREDTSTSNLHMDLHAWESQCERGEVDSWIHHIWSVNGHLFLHIRTPFLETTLRCELNKIFVKVLFLVISFFCWHAHWHTGSGECTFMEAAQTEARAPDRSEGNSQMAGHPGHSNPTHSREYIHFSISLAKLWWYCWWLKSG